MTNCEAWLNTDKPHDILQEKPADLMNWRNKNWIKFNGPEYKIMHSGTPVINISVHRGLMGWEPLKN